MLRARISKLTEREQVHRSNAKARREFISSVLGPKSLPAQQNPTRAPNKGVWRLIYRQFFVSVTGVAGVTWLARQDERMSCLFLVNMTQVLEPVVWSLTGSIPGQGSKVSNVSRPQSQNTKRYCNKSHRFKKWSTAKQNSLKNFHGASWKSQCVSGLCLDHFF